MPSKLRLVLARPDSTWPRLAALTHPPQSLIIPHMITA